MDARVVRDDNRPGKPVVGLTTLTKNVTDDDLKLLAQFPELRFLHISGSQVKGPGLKQLAGLKHLSRLNLGFSDITDAGVKELAALPALRELDLMNTNLTDDGVKALLALTELESLYLGQNFEVTDGAYKTLAGLKKLRRLQLSNSRAGDETMKAFADHPELRMLTIKGTDVTDAGHAAAAKMPKLEQFGVGYSCTNAGLRAIGASGSLVELDLFGAAVTADAILAMPRAPHLQKLSVRFDDKVKDAELKKLKAGLPKCEIGSLFWVF
jgi:hypothetical protein